MDRTEYARIMSKYTVLFVDDDDGIVENLARVYKRYFKEVYTAANGLLGIEQYEKYKPDIVITDVTMPKCDGIKMATEIKKADPELKVIFSSGHNEEDFIKEFEKFGGFYLTKPMDMTTLLNMILVVLKEEQ